MGIYNCRCAHAGTFCKIEIPAQPQNTRPNATLTSRADAVRRGDYPGPVFPVIKRRGNVLVSNGKRWYDADGNVYRWWVVDLALEVHPRSAEAYRQGNQNIGGLAGAAVGQLVANGHDLAQTESQVPDGSFVGAAVEHGQIAADVSPQRIIMRFGGTAASVVPALCMYNLSLHNAWMAEER